MRPSRIVHADWSVDPAKRWAAFAVRDGDGYSVSGPALTTPTALLAHLAAPGTFAGFDFPIGLPMSYARRAGIKNFPDFVRELDEKWPTFAQVATSKNEISIARPFYPARPGGTSRADLVTALGLADDEELYRRCEREGGRRACPLFWTLGGNQVGKGALSGWKSVIAPALLSGCALWPFDGQLSELFASGRSVMAETYPGDIYGYVGATLPRDKATMKQGKRSQASRAGSAESIIQWCMSASVVLTPELLAIIRGGFGSSKDGEDKFDAVIGVLGMIAVVTGARQAGAPVEPAVSLVEGWILGRTQG